MFEANAIPPLISPFFLYLFQFLIYIPIVCNVVTARREEGLQKVSQLAVTIALSKPLRKGIVLRPGILSICGF